MDQRLMYRREFFIGGTWTAPAGTGRLGVISPSTEEIVGEVPAATTADIDIAVGAARSAFDDGPWPRTTPGERAGVLARAAGILRKRQSEIAGVTVDEMGCAISQAPQAQRVSLELGGKSAAIILDDADLARVVPALVGGAMHLSGQVCGAHTRVLVPLSRYPEAVEAAAAAASAVPVGDPHDPRVLVGPLVAERQRDRVEGYIALAVQAGARVAAGGARPAHLPKGWYVAPTILADVDNSMRVAREEIFGPVLCLIPYSGEEDAVRIANDSPYGLAGGVWTGDPARGLRVARRVRTGSIAINGTYPPFPLVPFGGFRESGLGRELGPEGLQSFLEPRSIGLPASLRSAQAPA